MGSLFELDALVNRLKLLCEREAWKPEAFTILEAALLKGEIPRGDISRISGMKERRERAELAKWREVGLLLPWPLHVQR